MPEDRQGQRHLLTPRSGPRPTGNTEPRSLPLCSTLSPGCGGYLEHGGRCTAQAGCRQPRTGRGMSVRLKVRKEEGKRQQANHLEK